MGVQFGWGQTVGQEAPDVVPVGIFSEMDPSRVLPKDWRTVSLSSALEETTYELVASRHGNVVRAQSAGSASPLVTKCDVDLTEYPILEWSWKVDGIVENGDARVKEREDYPARLYISFESDDLSLMHRLKVVALRAMGYDVVPRRSIVYIWANRVERYTVLPSTYASWWKLVPVRSGTAHVDAWVTERRNVLADYRRIFDKEPPGIRRIGIMTDTDNTGGAATAHYGDIVFRATRPDSATVDTTLHLQTGTSE